MSRRLVIARPFLVGAFLVALVAVGFSIAQLLSSDSVIWTGRCVPATLRGGLAYYHANGQNLEVADPTAGVNSPTRQVTVCYDPAHPEQGMVPHTVTRVFEGSLVLIPMLIAASLALYGLVIRPARIKDIDEAVPWTINRPS